jgi:hypothetical protein
MFKYFKSPLFLVTGMLVLAGIACSFSFSTAKIENVRLARDESGNDRTETFGPADTVYVLFDLKSAPDDTTVKAIWKVVSVEGMEANTELGESEELETGSANIWFSYDTEAALLAGRYKVEIYMNGERETSKEFTIEALGPSIANVRIARDNGGEDQTDTFAPTDNIYVLFDLTNAPSDTTVQAFWKTVDVEGEESDLQFAESEVLETASTDVLFSLAPSPDGLPEGTYKVDIYLNGEQSVTREFTIAN